MKMMWTTCVNGHDLTADGAWLYANGGNRTCRACAETKGKKKRATAVYGAFDGAK